MVRRPISQVRQWPSLNLHFRHCNPIFYRQRFGQSNGTTPFISHDVEVGQQASAQYFMLINRNRHMNLFNYADKIENAALLVG